MQLCNNYYLMSQNTKSPETKFSQNPFNNPMSYELEWLCTCIIIIIIISILFISYVLVIFITMYTMYRYHF